MKVWQLILVGIVLIGGIVGCRIAYLEQSETVIVKVTGKERVNEKESSRYLIFTESETFENTDSIYYGKFNSSDVYGRIEAGKSYSMKVCGWRIQFLSVYRNIIEANEVK